MKRVFGYRNVLVVLVCVALLVLGCGSGDKGVKVEGRIVRSGQPYAAKEGEPLNLSFTGKNSLGEDATYPAKVNTDGSFLVDGPGGKGIPPGTYKVRVNVGSGGSDPASLSQLEEANRQFAQINDKDCEVANVPNQKITIDLEKGTIGK